MIEKAIEKLSKILPDDLTIYKIFEDEENFYFCVDDIKERYKRVGIPLYVYNKLSQEITEEDPNPFLDFGKKLEKAKQININISEIQLLNKQKGF